MMRSRGSRAFASFLLLTAVGSSAQVPGDTAVDMTALSISAPKALRDIDTRGARGTPTRLAWSPDGAWIYVRVSTFDRWSNETVKHLLIETQGKRVEPLADEPGWLARYWNLKSALASPAVPSWRIVIDMRYEQVRTINVPREGNIGQHSADPTAGLDEVIRNSVNSSQKTMFEQFLLNGRVIGSAINGHVPPGRTFAWAPEPLALVAFVTERGRLAVMNARGHVRDIKGVKKPLLPAWSDNGQQLAYAQQTSSGAYTLKAVTIR